MVKVFFCILGLILQTSFGYRIFPFKGLREETARGGQGSRQARINLILRIKNQLVGTEQSVVVANALPKTQQVQGVLGVKEAWRLWAMTHRLTHVARQWHRRYLPHQRNTLLNY